MTPTIPNQKQFNDDHVHPVYYGEDGDMAVGNQFTQTEAYVRFNEQYLSDTGEELGEEYGVDNVSLMNFGWGVHPDYRNDEDNMSYVLIYDSDGSETKPRYTGWVLAI